MISMMRSKSVKSKNQWKSVIPTVFDIVKAHDGESKVGTKIGIDTTFMPILPVTW